jgi:hypothetical protein
MVGIIFTTNKRNMLQCATGVPNVDVETDSIIISVVTS